MEDARLARSQSSATNDLPNAALGTFVPVMIWPSGVLEIGPTSNPAFATRYPGRHRHLCQVASAELTSAATHGCSRRTASATTGSGSRP